MRLKKSILCIIGGRGGQKFVEPFFVCVYSRNKKFFSCLFEGKETFM